MNVPEIRFKEFCDYYSDILLEKCLSVSNKKNNKLEYKKEDALSVSDEFGVVNQIEHLGRSYIIRKTKCFDFWERNVLFPKTKRSFFRTPKHPLPCPFPLNFSLLIITKKFGNLAKNRYICIV